MLFPFWRLSDSVKRCKFKYSNRKSLCSWMVFIVEFYKLSSNRKCWWTTVGLTSTKISIFNMMSRCQYVVQFGLHYHARPWNSHCQGQVPSLRTPAVSNTSRIKKSRWQKCIILKQQFINDMVINDTVSTKANEHKQRQRSVASPELMKSGSGMGFTWGTAWVAQLGIRGYNVLPTLAACTIHRQADRHPFSGLFPGQPG